MIYGRVNDHRVDLTFGLIIVITWNLTYCRSECIFPQKQPHMIGLCWTLFCYKAGIDSESWYEPHKGILTFFSRDLILPEACLNYFRIFNFCQYSILRIMVSFWGLICKMNIMWTTKLIFLGRIVFNIIIIIAHYGEE